MSTITFADVVGEKLGESFGEFKYKPELCSYISNGVPIAVAACLASEMEENDKTESELIIELSAGKLMRFGLKSVKKGDSIAFIPEFDLLDLGKEYINSDEINFDADSTVMLSKKLSSNENFVTALKQAFAGKVYDAGDWLDIGNGEEKGLVFEDEEDIALVTTFVFISIMEILCNNKDASGRDLSYTVPGFGEFTVKAVKDGYTVSLTFDKEFKAICKNDVYAEKLVDRITE